MKILVTGAKGFVGSNLCQQLQNIAQGKAKQYNLPDPIIDILPYDIDSDPQLLDTYCEQADFVYNLAGVNRPQNIEDFMSGNFGFSSILLDTLRRYNNKCPIVLSSSIQAELNNPYGKSKKAGENLFFNYEQETGAKVLVYRFPNLFGKWCKPNYNSVVATFCHNIANDLPIQVNDPETQLNLVYIDDVVDELISALSGLEHKKGKFCYVPISYDVKLKEIVKLLVSYNESRKNLSVPDFSNTFSKKLYSTYLSYLPVNKFSYPLKMNIDERGSFTEIIRTQSCGQFSINISKPHITKGQHWHNTKNEKFVVVSGTGLIQFRNMKDPESPIIEYSVSGEKLEVIDIPTGYTHNIINTGEIDLITFMWCNECFDPEKPDTYFEPV